MAPPDDEPKPKGGGDGLKGKLGGWFQKALGGDAAPRPAEPAPDAFPPPPPARPTRPGSGPLGAGPAGARPAGSGPLPPSPGPSPPGSGPLPPAAGSGPLNRAGSSSSLRLPGMGPAAGGSGPLGGEAGRAGGAAADADPATWTTSKPLTGPLPGEREFPMRAAGTGELDAADQPTGSPPEGPPAAPAEAAASRPAAGPEDPAAASRRRMAFIVAYMKDPTGDRDFADKPLVYRIMSEEREHQQTQVGVLQEQLRRLGAAAPDDAEAAARREELEARLKTAQNRQAQLFLQLKKLTGVKGKTGGTGFLVAADLPPGPPVLPPKPPEPRPE